MSRLLTREAAWVSLLLVVAALWGGRYVQQWRDEGEAQVFYQSYFEPAILIACGHGFALTEARPPAVSAFLQQKTDRFDCAQLTPDLSVTSEGLYQYAWFYLMWMVGAYWWVMGVSWSGLVPLFGLLFAVVIGLAYAVFRLAVPLWAAGLAAAALMVSPLHLQNLPHLRDYAKAPFVLGLLLVLFLIVRRPTPLRLLALSALYGVVLGIGYGFRADFLANIPPLIFTVVLFVPGFGPRALALKVASLVLAAVLFIGVSWPTTSYVVAQGGCQGHVILLGLEHNFTRDLGVAPSHYQWISRLSDEYVHTSVNSFHYRTTGGAPAGYCTPDYDAASGRYLAALATAFPADVLTRAYASTLRVIDLPFFAWTAGPSALRSQAGDLLTYFVGVARLSTIAAVLLLGAWSWRLGLCAVAMILYFGAYPSLQFHQRHFFHLEFIGWWAMAFVGWQAVRLLQWRTGRGEAPWGSDGRHCARRALQFMAVVILVVLLPLPILRAYQDAQFNALVTHLLEAPRVVVAVEPGAEGEALNLAGGMPLETGADPTETAYLDVRLDLQQCPEGVALGVRYDPANPIYDFSSTVQWQPDGTAPARVLLPVYAGFSGLTLGGAPARCVSSVDRLASVEGFPLLPVLTLPADWQEHPQHQRVGRLALRLSWLGY